MTLAAGGLKEAQAHGAQAVRKTVAFDGSAGNGAVGTVNLFTVTGGVNALVIAVCTESLVGATATIEVGTAGTTNGIIVQTTAENIDIGMIWVDDSPALLECWTTGFGCMIGDGADIIATIGTAAVTDGTLIFTAFWTPLTNDGNLVAA